MKYSIVHMVVGVCATYFFDELSVMIQQLVEGNLEIYEIFRSFTYHLTVGNEELKPRKNSGVMIFYMHIKTTNSEINSLRPSYAYMRQ